MVKPGLPEDSILRPPFFLIYINELSDNLLSSVKLFVDDTLLFFVVNGSDISTNKLNKNLQKISKWAYEWKMSFNPVLNKQAQEVIFS